MKKCGCSEKFSCGCCEGIEILTPQATANRPGLSTLRYRVGTHSTFFETMLARLSNSYLETAEIDAAGNLTGSKTYPLKNLNTRAADDPSIALLDASAMMLDVLTFYQERIVNEGYLKTATERRSILELARLVGYTLRPGVAASVFLAYTMDDNSEPVEIPLGARAQSVPAPVKSSADAAAQSAPPPAELPQSFETSEKIEARKEWNDLKPRAARPQNITAVNAAVAGTIYFKGTETNLKPNDPLLFVPEGQAAPPVFRKVKSVEPLFDEQKTRVTLQSSLDDAALPAQGVANVSSVVSATTPSKGNGETNDAPKGHFSTSAFRSLINLTAPLSLPPSRQPANSLLLNRVAAKVFDLSNDTLPQILTAFNKDIGTTAYQAWANATVTEPLPVKVYVLRLTAPLFGNTAPPRFEKNNQTGVMEPVGEHWIVEASGSTPVPVPGPPPPALAAAVAIRRRVIKHEEEKIIYLDSSYDKIAPDSWIVIDMSAIKTAERVGDEDVPLLKNFSLSPNKVLITRTKDVSPAIPRTDYGMSAKTTRIELRDSWIQFKSDVGDVLRTSEAPEFQIVRKTVVYAQSEQLELADEPISDDVRGDRIELGALYDGLRSGRWIIVSGERTDIANTSGVRASELVMLAGIEQSYDRKLPGDKIHSTLILAKSLAYTYKRASVRIYGNVVKATHGETRSEILGSGNAAQAMPAFTLKQPPLTYVSAPTASGIKNTLVVRVNDVEWKEADSLVELNPQDRNFVTKTDDEAKTTVIFGNGEQGARLPTGIENVKAVYRSGIGKPGNVKAEQISLLMTKPLGVREVINPLRASGGADKETGDQARRNVPIALMALDRLVSTKDYADFARTFAGIGKASAVRLSDGRRQIVHLTIAGADDIPIDVNSDLFNNLHRALAKYGDSFVPVRVVQRELIALVIAANVHIRPDYLWESVEPKIRASLRYIFSFERRELGQSVFLSEVINAIQRVEGVLYVDVDIFDGISETEIKNEESIKDKKSDWTKPNRIAGDLKKHVSAKPARFDKDSKKIVPAQLAYLMPDVPDTLILNKIEEVKK